MKISVFAFLLLLLGCISSGSLAAQTLDEWLRPKKTQLEYLAGHLVSLKLYSYALQEGYLLFRQGSELISDVNNGEFSLHKNYFLHRHQWSPIMEKLSGLEQARSILKRLGPEAGSMAAKISVSNLDPQIRNALRGSCLHVLGECNRLSVEIENLRIFPNDDDHQKWERANAINREVQGLNRNFHGFKINLYEYLKMGEMYQKDLDWTNKMLLR